MDHPHIPIFALYRTKRRDQEPGICGIASSDSVLYTSEPPNLDCDLISEGITNINKLEMQTEDLMVKPPTKC
jgi:hypothetical protein